MTEVFLIQLVAAALGALSTAIADWTHKRGRIGLRLHIFWVSASIAAIYLPVLWWIANIFLGPGVLGELIAVIVVGTIFISVYRNLPKPRSPQNPGRRPLPPHSSGAAPPMAESNS